MSLLAKKIQTPPITVKKNPEVIPPAQQAEVAVKRHVNIEVSESEDVSAFPTLSRGSMYDFRLGDMVEKKRYFIKLPEGLTMATLKAALTQHIAIERAAREFKQNFRALPDKVNGSDGFWVYCLSIKDMPMRKHKNKDEGETEAQSKVA